MATIQLWSDMLQYNYDMICYNIIMIWYATIQLWSDMLQYNYDLICYNILMIWYATIQLWSDMLQYNYDLICYNIIMNWYATIQLWCDNHYKRISKCRLVLVVTVNNGIIIIILYTNLQQEVEKLIPFFSSKVSNLTISLFYIVVCLN